MGQNTQGLSQTGLHVHANTLLRGAQQIKEDDCSGRKVHAAATCNKELCECAGSAATVSTYFTNVYGLACWWDRHTKQDTTAGVH